MRFKIGDRVYWRYGRRPHDRGTVKSIDEIWVQILWDDGTLGRTGHDSYQVRHVPPLEQLASIDEEPEIQDR